MSDAASISDMFDLGALDQVSYAVRNLEEATRRFAPLFGPFMTVQAELDEVSFRGRSGPVVLNIAFGRSGPLEVELVEVVSGEAPQAEFLERHGEGLHHVRFVVDDIDAKIALMRPHGFSEVAAGRTAGIRFAYLEAPDFLGDNVIELMQHTPVTKSD